MWLKWKSSASDSLKGERMVFVLISENFYGVVACLFFVCFSLEVNKTSEPRNMKVSNVCNPCSSLTNPLLSVLIVCCLHSIFFCREASLTGEDIKLFIEASTGKFILVTFGWPLEKEQTGQIHGVYSMSSYLAWKRQPCSSDTQGKITFRAVRNQNPQR